MTRPAPTSTPRSTRGGGASGQKPPRRSHAGAATSTTTNPTMSTSASASAADFNTSTAKSHAARPAPPSLVALAESLPAAWSLASLRRMADDADRALAMTAPAPLPNMQGAKHQSVVDAGARAASAAARIALAAYDLGAHDGAPASPGRGAHAPAGRSLAVPASSVRAGPPPPVPRLLVDTPTSRPGGVLRRKSRGSTTPAQHAPVPPPPQTRPQTPPEAGPLEGPRKFQFKAQWVPSPSSSSTAATASEHPVWPPPRQPASGSGPAVAFSPLATTPASAGVSTNPAMTYAAAAAAASPPPPRISAARLREPVKLGGLPINRTAPEFLERLARVRRAQSYGQQLRAAAIASQQQQQRTSSRASNGPASTSEDPSPSLPLAPAPDPAVEEARARRRKMAEYAAGVPRPRAPVLPPLAVSAGGSISHVAGPRGAPPAAQAGGGGPKSEHDEELEALTQRYWRDLAVVEKIKSELRVRV
ncbi:hypothetical protein H9P43_008930 [Blastocladiella emersonii ATCC 22665]|nr:hypothetical protein H9P43_008930 [Blastocladiella emersonii ATCC 22665]